MNERNVNHRDASSGERAPKLLESADRVFENVAPRFMLGVPPPPWVTTPRSGCE